MRKSIKEIINAFKECQNYSETGRKLGIDRKTVNFWVIKGRSIHNQGYISSKGLKLKGIKENFYQTKNHT